MKSKHLFFRNPAPELVSPSSKHFGANALSCIEIGALLLCIFCVGLMAIMNLAGRSLWFDEAMLVWSIENRTLTSLVSSPLDWNQTAPVLYVYILKFATLVFGHSEAVYRLPSLASCMLLPLATWFVSKHIFRIPCPWTCAAFVANMPVLFVYSNQVKPYAVEALCSLLVLIFWWSYSEKHLSWRGLALGWTVLALLGNPSFFLIGGCIAVEFVSALLHKDSPAVSRILLCTALCATFLAVYYWLWLRPVATRDKMQNYWQASMLPFPATPARIRIFFSILSGNLFAPAFGKRLVFIAPTLGLSCLFATKGFPRHVIAVWVALGGAVVASCFRMFPINLRLWVFAIPLISILACWAWCRLLRHVAPSVIAAVGLLAFAFANLGLVKFRHPLDCHMEGEEINASLDFLRNHLHDGDSVYVFLWSTPGLQFKNGYGNSRLPPSSHDNIIWGGEIWNSPTFEQDITKIESSSPCWLLASHAFQNSNAGVAQTFLERLGNSGTLVLVDNSFSTPLYRYDKAP